MIRNKSIHTTKNIFGNNIKFIKLETKNGAWGILTSILTSAESIQFMISSITKIVYDHLPAVIHVKTRSIDYENISYIMVHSSLLSCFESRFIMISSDSVQEIHDLAIASHLIAFATKTSVIHFLMISK